MTPLPVQPCLPIPNHVAIIMDGNGRWATQKGLSRREGHRHGMMALHRLIQALPSTGVRYLTVYAFSSENWRRPPLEIRGLMTLLVLYLKRYTPELIANNVRLHTIGRINELPKIAAQELRSAQEKTAHCDQYHLTLALNYGSRNEVVDAVRRYVTTTQPTSEALENLTWEAFSTHLDTYFLPEPDLLIRTSGEERLSNFLLLQLAYTELYTTPTLWPDFTLEHLQEGITDYQKRCRRHGGTGE